MCFPGQLAAWRHLRREKLAVERCVKADYPASVRQPLTKAYFRKIGVAERDIPLRWSAPTARIRVVTGKRGGEMTIHERVMKAGEADIVAQIDFAQSLPALFLDGGTLSTGASWEASLDDSPMYDIIGFEHEYMVRGDAGFVRMFKDRIQEMLGFLTGLQEERGFVNAKAVESYGFFPDWSVTKATGPDPHGTPAYGQMLLAGTFAAGARLRTPGAIR